MSRIRLTTDGNPQSPPPLTAALLTPRGRGAVATIGFRGDCRLIDSQNNAVFRAANGKPLVDQPIDQVVFGHWGQTVTEEVVVCRVDENAAEIHCHGGDAAARRILDDLEALGCTILAWPEMTVQSTGRFEAECTEALTRATTLRTAEILLEQRSGILKKALQQLLPCVEIGTPYSVLRAQLDELLKWSDFGLHLSEPWFVVLTGRPNVGKSSLINALVGYSRSIVYNQPGTTRDVVTAETAFEGWPIRFADTAGIRTLAGSPNGRKSEPIPSLPSEEEDIAGAALEEAGIDRARKTLAEADCRLLLVDVSKPPHEDDHRLRSKWPDAILVAHKCDLPNRWANELPHDALPVSSITGAGIDKLAATLVARIIPEVPASGTPIPVTGRQIDLLKQARQAADQGDAAAVQAALAACLA